MAWQNNILRVNLSTGSCNSEALNRDWAQAYLGQRGLGSKYLVEEIDPTIDPLSPENKLIIATGPLTATTAPTGGRSSAVTKGALTGAIAASNTGGMFGAELKMAGYDLLIIEGRAEQPVYLWIRDDQVEIRPAQSLWGQSVWETEPWLRRELQEPQAKIASIGRAGEVGVKFACIVNDMDRAYGRSGVGAVMGSKHLKAIAVRGTRGVRVANPKAFREAVGDTMAVLQPSPVRQRFTSRGTHNMMDVTNQFGSLPTRNCRDVKFEGVEPINADAVRVPRRSDGKPSLQGNKACFARGPAGRRSRTLQTAIGRARVRDRLRLRPDVRHRRSRCYQLRQLLVQRTKHGPDFARCLDRRGHGTVRRRRDYTGRYRWA
jgi:aldehyde:ferredoxin oxidoreductase